MNNPIRKLLWVAPGDPEKSLDSATWLDTSGELNQSGWNVTLLAVGDGKSKTLKGVHVYGVPRPEIYLMRQFVFTPARYPIFIAA